MLALLIWRILTASLGAGRVSGHRMIDVIPGGDQRPGQQGGSVPGRGGWRGCRERRRVPSPSPAPRSHAWCDDTSYRTAHAALIGEILGLLAGNRPAPPPAGPRPPVEPLSDSELRVLRYLPTNLTTPEIVGELYVSVNTVRTHVGSLYVKLGAHRRADAVTRARDLGLLAPSTRSARQRALAHWLAWAESMLLPSAITARRRPPNHADRVTPAHPGESEAGITRHRRIATA
jgi:DNA-binding CsgD family transcriptional regulator